ncbi:MAG: 5-formyltetrahydrofolate cyclo-ligase [Pseudomonadota bacterium]|nr:5-formyltetrahydrofolate cyclo-ligase [Pseudomonadota bacterium]
MLSKELLRKKYFKLRKKKYYPIKKNFFMPLIKILKKLKKKNLVIGIYYPILYEVNVLKILEFGIFNKCIISLPIIKKDQIKFYQWNKTNIMQVNKYGILEPILTNNQVNPDVILIPLLVYDDKKNRLGYGKGYYDKFLSHFLKKNKDILTMGIAFSFQKYKKIPTSWNDIKLDNILTEKGIF